MPLQLLAAPLSPLPTADCGATQSRQPRLSGGIHIGHTALPHFLRLNRPKPGKTATGAAGQA